MRIQFISLAHAYVLTKKNKYDKTIDITNP